MRKYVGYGWMFAFICLLLSTLGIAMMFQFEKIETLSIGLVFAVHISCVFIGSYIGGKKSHMRGWFVGLFIAVFYTALLGMIGYLGFEQPLQSSFLLMTIICWFAGLFGGALGVNRRM